MKESSIQKEWVKILVEWAQAVVQHLNPSKSNFLYQHLKHSIIWLNFLIKNGNVYTWKSLKLLTNIFVSLKTARSCTSMVRGEILMTFFPKFWAETVESEKWQFEDKSLRFFFQAEQIPQAILFYNKSLCYAPHPDFEEYTWPPGIRHSFFSSFSVYFNTFKRHGRTR